MVYKIDLTEFKNISEADKELLTEILSGDSEMSLERRTAIAQEIFAEILSSKSDTPKSENPLDLSFQSLLSHNREKMPIEKTVRSNRSGRETPAKDPIEEWQEYIGKRQAEYNEKWGTK